MMQVRAERVARTMAATGMDELQAVYHERARNFINEGFRRDMRFNDHRFDSAEPAGVEFADRLRAVALANLGLDA